MERDGGHAGQSHDVRPYDTKAVENEPRGGGEGITYLTELIARGRPEPAAVAHLVRAYSVNGYGDEMYGLLQQRLGNAYVQQVIAILRREEASPAPTPTASSDGHHKYALIAAGAEKEADPRDDPQFPGMDTFSPQVLQAMPFFADHGYDTRLLYGDSPKAVNRAQEPGLAEITKQANKRHVPTQAFTPDTIKAQLAQIAASVQPGDEVMVMIASHGYNEGSNDKLPKLDWNDPTSGRYAFLSGHQDMHLDELAPYRDMIEKKGAKLAVLLMTCTSQFGLQFASSSGQTSVVSETGVDKGQGDFAVSFLSNLKPGMTLEEAFGTGKRLMHKAVDDPHISTDVTGKPSGFTF
jgi:hypothetical protein